MARLYVGADRGPNRGGPARRGGAPLCAIDNAFGFRGACSASVRRVNVWWRTLLTIWRAKVLLRRNGLISPRSVGRVRLRTLPTDIDLLMHMNNGRYASLFDLGRFDLQQESWTPATHFDAELSGRVAALVGGPGGEGGELGRPAHAV